MSLEACRNTLYDLATPEKVHFYRNPETLTVSRRDLLELHDALGRISTEHMM